MTTALGFSVLFPWEILQYLKQSSYRKYQGEHIYYSWGCIDLHSQHDSKRIFTTSEKTPFSFFPCLTFSTHSSFLSHTWPHKNWVQGRIEADTQKHRHGKRMEWFLRFSYNQNRMDLKTTCTMMAKQSQMQ